MHLRGNLMLLLAAFIWGTTFVAQMVGMDGLGPFTYAAARYILGLLFLVGLWYAWRSSREGAKRAGTYRPGWKAGLGAGCIMMVATSLQQVAMLYTTAGKTAFITALYIIFVPLGAVLLGKRIHPENWAGAAMALLGLYFLSIHGAVSLSFGDGLVFISALFWTGHILFIDRFASLVDPIELSLTQVGVCAAGSLIAALGFETVAVQPVLNAWFAIFYGGVMSAGVALAADLGAEVRGAGAGGHHHELRGRLRRALELAAARGAHDGRPDSRLRPDARGHDRDAGASVAGRSSPCILKNKVLHCIIVFISRRCISAQNHYCHEVSRFKIRKCYI